MSKHLNRRKFLSTGTLALSGLAIGTHSAPAIAKNSLPENKPAWNPPALTSLPASDVFSVLDLNLPVLSSVKKALEKKGHHAALSALLAYYRERYPKEEALSHIDTKNKATTIQRADDIGKHIFQWGPYPAASYGPDIDWAADPAGDIEWIANMYRFYWVAELATAYAATNDERYAQTFVDLTVDWIKKHPLEVSLYEDHPVYGVAKGGYWRGYAWLDLQTGIRATKLCQNFRLFVHSKAFTPEFLGILLASLYDHEVKTEHMPMANVHNKAIFEQRGFFNVIHTFPEFKDKDRWLDIAMKITHENLLAQTTTDGVQREWCGGYHFGVYRDALEIDGRVSDLGRSMPADYRERVEGMANHIFGISTPELAFPMFGDTARSPISSKDRKTWQLYNMLGEASKRFNDPKYQALADLDLKALPKNGSAAFPSAGLYAMRSEWTPDQVYMAVHCSPPAISGHATADNGTFELYAHGRWLMPDSGYYTYGHDKKARAWHRQTRIHATLTVNGKDTDIIGRHRDWQSDENADLLCVENFSYRHFLHRRTFWFSGKKSPSPFFVILDEAIGDDKGDIEIHFPMAPGKVNVDKQHQRITTGFDDANLLIQVNGKHPISLYEEQGWHAWKYGNRERRTSVTAVYKGQAPSVFVSILVPYRGTSAPSCRLLTDPTTLIAGQDPVEIAVEIAGQKHTLQRNI